MHLTGDRTGQVSKKEGAFTGPEDQLTGRSGEEKTSLCCHTGNAECTMGLVLPEKGVVAWRRELKRYLRH